ncbi:MAG TPA: hypothetical protein VGS00_09585 [Thermoanaerobaculia bacterium]|nr:hypothetical protein [Thermoanaerobaculia bacterium]
MSDEKVGEVELRLQPLDELGAIVKDGRLSIEADLQAGRMQATPAWAIEVQGAPTAKVVAEARAGKIEKLHFGVEGGRLIARGEGLRPKVSVESLDFESPAGIQNLKFHGIGIWRPIVAVFGGIGRSAVSHLALRTDVPSVLKGDIFGKPAAAPLAAPGPPGAGLEPSFLELVREVRIVEMTLTAFEGRTVSFEPFIEFSAATDPKPGDVLRLTIDRGVFHPGRGGLPPDFRVAGRLDGAFEQGAMAFGKDRAAFSRGRIEGGSFHAESGEGGRVATSVAAAKLGLELSSGDFEVPGGLRVALAEGSRFSASGLTVAPSGSFSGVLDFDLIGKTGALARQGTSLSAANLSVRSSGLTVTNNRATGPVSIAFDYLLRYTLVVKYPIASVAEKRVPLEFQGPFSAQLDLVEAGGDDGEVRGDYVFKAPWPPIEKAALEVLAAKWRQDVAVKNVDFSLEPRLFRPCGGDCFQLAFGFTAEKKQRKGSLFKQLCEPVGQAKLFIDRDERAFILRDVKVEAHCKGAMGWVVNLVAPLLARTYSDTVLFKMPPDLPLTIDKVQGGVEWLSISGGFDWKARGARPAAAPQ